ncbi:MAG: hypothetical protein LBK76_04750 [Verrucomicrobiales bacterium]|jgi:hypothetical protein|nr:hypothetical protein [Verrucomicrobiales bacterium]
MKKQVTNIFAVATLTVALGNFTFADGLRVATLPPSAPAPAGLTLDGRADDWRAVPGYTLSPVELLRGTDALTAALAEKKLALTVRTCFDADALYLAAEWTDDAPGENRAADGDAARWDAGGEGLELHLRADRVTHLAVWPAAGGKKFFVKRHAGDEPVWRDAAGEVTVSGSVIGSNKFFMELRVPWSLVTVSGGLPADGKLQLALDATWNALPAQSVSALRRAKLQTADEARGVTWPFLTARPPAVGQTAIFNPAEWGALTLTTGAADGGDLTQATPAGRNLRTLPVGRAAAAPAIDGKLDDWPAATFQTIAYLPEIFGHRFGGRTALRYDDRNLYLAAEFTVSGTVLNLKSEATQAGFNGGDALQIRLRKDNRTVNLCVWPDSLSGRAALTADGVELANPFLLKQGARAATRPAADGGSYALELAVPWTLLFDQSPSAGDTIAATLQPWWADLMPRCSLIAELTLQKRGALTVPFTMPKDAEVSLGLFTPDGQLVRWLRQNEFRYAGDHAADWDGLDQYGRPAAAGDYVLRGVWHGKLGTEWLATANNPGNPPWPTADDRGDWLNDEGPPQAAATDGDWVFLGSPGSEKGFSVIAVDGDGQRRWGFALGGNPRSVALTVSGEYLYVMYSGPEITEDKGGRVFTGDNAVGRALLICLEKSTGRLARFSKEQPRLKIATWPYREEYTYMWELRNAKNFTLQKYGGQPRYFRYDIAESTNALGLAAVGDKLYVALLYDNKIVEYAADSGRPTGVEISVPAPLGLCRLDDSTLLAVSGRQVLRVDLAARKTLPMISGNLAAPAYVTTDQTGHIYVSDWADSFQVKKFDRAGRFLKAVGKAGGRPWVGPWEADGMLLPRGIAVTDRGRLWVTEDDMTPKRVSVWDADTGKLLRDYLGPTGYGGGGHFWIDPKAPDEITSNATRFKVDFANKTYRPLAISYRRADLADCFMPSSVDWSLPVRALYHGKDEFVFIPHNRNNLLALLKRDGDTWHTAAAVGFRFRDHKPQLNGDGTQVFEWDSDIGYHRYDRYYPEFFKGHFEEWFAWNDADGDHRAQANEMQWRPAVNPRNDASADGGIPRLETPWTGDLGKDFSLYYCGGFKDGTGLMRWTPRAWNAAGDPVYDPADIKLLALLPKQAVSNVHVTRDDKIIITYSYEWGKGADAFAAYDLNGRHLWSIALRDKLEGDNVHATGVVYDYDVPGIGTVCATWNWHGSYKTYLFTTDGDYLGAPLDDSRNGPAATWDESYRGGYQTPDGEPWLINGANQQMHILKLKGLEPGAAGKFTSNYTLTVAAAEQAKALRELPETKPKPQPIISVAWRNPPLTVDGKLDDWVMSEGVALDNGQGRRAVIALRRDATRLYLAAQVWEPTPPLRNGGADWRQLFITGDAVDLMLQTDLQADPHHRGPAAGDARLLFSVFEGQPIAVRYKPVSPGAREPVQMLAAKVDEVIRLKDAQIAVQRNEQAGWYVIEAAVPLAALNLDPRYTGKLRGDVGVIFADETGRNRALRLYYYNKKTNITADLTTEATLQPEEWGEIQLPLGVNLLKNGGFEEPFADSDRAGWQVNDHNGNFSAVSADLPRSGARSLLMGTAHEQVFPDAMFDNPDFGAFIRSANGNQGMPMTQVRQRVPVTAGHRYAVRFDYLTEDMRGEYQGKGRQRGYTDLGGRIDWICAPQKNGVSGLIKEQHTKDTWQRQENFNGWAVPRPYEAPPGATEAVVNFMFRTIVEKCLARAYLDNIEMVDVTAQ